MPNKKDFLARSERDGREGQKRSHGKHTGQAPDESARRPRDLESGVDYKSAHVRATVKPTSDRAPDLDQAAMASDRSRGRKALSTVQARTKKPAPRVEDPDSSDDSSDTATDSSTTDSDTSSVSSFFPAPRPYDGRADRDAFDFWEWQVKCWAEGNKLSDQEVMCRFRSLVSGKAEACFISNFTPSRFLRPREQTLKEVFKVIHEECFPLGYERTVHYELWSATQGSLRVEEFAHKLRSLAKRLPYINDGCLAAIFYLGVHKYIRVQFIMAGMSQVGGDFEALVKRASRCEGARRTLRAAQGGRRGRLPRTRS